MVCAGDDGPGVFTGAYDPFAVPSFPYGEGGGGPPIRGGGYSGLYACDGVVFCVLNPPPLL
jgi:hypothetical protein